MVSLVVIEIRPVLPSKRRNEINQLISVEIHLFSIKLTLNETFYYM